MAKQKNYSSFMGVCSTIANKYDLDVFLIRCAVVLLFILTTGFIVPIYVLLGLFAADTSWEEDGIDP
jgi:phage shock protein PspC (stress-responsive transcriptional regulator)